jgi:DNA modification methylase
LDESVGTVRHQDCIEGLNNLPAGSVDLVFADPPFNIGYDYDVYDDRKEREEYVAWCRRWIEGVHRSLKASGTFWLAIGDEHAAELKIVSQETGFHCRSWVIWYYTFGVNCTRKFSRSHAHLFYFVKDVDNFTFRESDPENRVPSARQLVYADMRANPKGRLPDDTWILRPQDLTDCFTPDEDTWYFPRVAGTFKERAGFHGCQMPEQLLGRIIRTCSNEGDLVVDPFAGSSTTLVVAKKLGRRFLGFDISEDYVRRGTDRLEQARSGDLLDGAADPLRSAPTTAKGKTIDRKLAKRGRPAKGASALKEKRRPHPDPLPEACEREQDALTPALLQKPGRGSDKTHTAAPVAETVRGNEKTLTPFLSGEGKVRGDLAELTEGLIEAFRRSSNGFSLDRVVADPVRNETFCDACRSLGLEGAPRLWNHLLFRLRKSGRLAGIPTRERTEFSWHACDRYLFASEIALKQMFDAGCHSLDEILCDPESAGRFDHIAARFAPGFSSLEYRWAALKLRKEARLVRSRAQRLRPGRFNQPLSIGCFDWSLVPQSPGIYRIACGTERKDQCLYVGEALNLRERLLQHFGDEDRLNVWHSEAQSTDLSFSTITADRHPTDLLAFQALFVRRHHPKLNLADFLAV